MPHDFKELTTVVVSTSTKGGTLSSGAKGGIAGGVVGAFVLVGVIALILILRRKPKDTKDNGQNQDTSNNGYNQDPSNRGYNQDTWDSGNNMDPKDGGDNILRAPELYDGEQVTNIQQYLVPKGVGGNLAGGRRDIEVAGGRLRNEKSGGSIE